MTSQPVQTSTAPLPFAVGVELAHALACAVAEDVGARALVIKGPSAAHHGLREPRISADADVWVEPARFDDVVAALGALGWESRPTTETGRLITTHSVTLWNQQWPCDIDLHSRYPGMLAPGAAAFDALWSRREALQQAGLDVPIPDLGGAVMISALHSLRSRSQDPRHERELDRLLGVTVPSLDALTRSAILSLAGELGALDTARPFLEELGIELPAPTAPGVDPELDHWRAFVRGDGTPTTHLLAIVVKAPWRDKPRLLWSAIWPSYDDYVVAHPGAPTSRDAVTRLRLARLGKGVRHLPNAVRGRIASMRGETDRRMVDGE